MFCFLVQSRAFVVLNLAGIAKFKYQRKNEIDSGSSEMTASCKWPIFFIIFCVKKKFSLYLAGVFLLG